MLTNNYFMEIINELKQKIADALMGEWYSYDFKFYVEKGKVTESAAVCNISEIYVSTEYEGTYFSKSIIVGSYFDMDLSKYLGNYERTGAFVIIWKPNVPIKAGDEYVLYYDIRTALDRDKQEFLAEEKIAIYDGYYVARELMPLGSRKENYLLRFCKYYLPWFRIRINNNVDIRVPSKSLEGIEIKKINKREAISKTKTVSGLIAAIYKMIQNHKFAFSRELDPMAGFLKEDITVYEKELEIEVATSPTEERDCFSDMIEKTKRIPKITRDVREYIKYMKKEAKHPNKDLILYSNKLAFELAIKYLLRYYKKQLQ